MAHTSISFSSTAMQAVQADQAIPVEVRGLLSDANQAGVTPAAPANGDAYIVNNWAAGNYVGVFAGTAYADGDLAMYSLALTGWVRLAINNGGAPATDLRCLVAAAGAAGSFVGIEDNIVQYDATGAAWEATVPVDDAMVRIVGDEAIFAYEQFSYDLPTTTWISMGKSNLSLGTTHIVDKTGNDDTGDGSIDRPYLTIAAAYAVAVAGDSIYVGPGVYAETIALAIRVNLIEFVPGTVNLANAVVGGSVLTIDGVGGTSVVRLNSIQNTNNATVADIALTVENTTPAAVVADVKVGSLNGGLLGSALIFDGDGTNAQATVLRLDADAIVGSATITTANAADLCEVRGRQHTATPATWCNIVGGAGTNGVVRFALFSTAAGILNVGGAAALGADVIFEAGSWFAGELELENVAGAGITSMLGDAAFDAVVAAANDQVYLRRIGHWLEINALNIDINAIDDTEFYTVPAAQTFLPVTVQTINRDAASGAALNYQYDGTGANSVVNALGVAALAFGVTNNVVLRDLMAAAAVLSLNVTAASTGAGDLADCRVGGILQNV